MTGRARRLLRIGLNVADLRHAITYYCDGLGFATVAEEEADPNWARLLAGEGVSGRVARIRLGAEELELVQFDPPGAKYPPDSTAADLWFQHVAIVTHDMDAAYKRLTRYGTTPITQGAPQRLPPAAGAVVAYKFRDRDGHPLELLHFPRDVGAPAWHHPGPATATLGIDHSAVSVADADRSIAFYASLGLAPASRQINAGAEQDRLDGLSGVAVDVVGLTPAGVPTPHVELLGYRVPRGRPRHPNSGSGDVVDSRLVLQVEGLTVLMRTLASLGSMTTPVVELASRARAALVRDPDGHAIVLLEFP